jgi:hypothetical protein
LVQKPELKQEEKDKLLANIADLTKLLEKKWYSNEFLYREYYINELS